MTTFVLIFATISAVAYIYSLVCIWRARGHVRRLVELDNAQREARR